MYLAGISMWYEHGCLQICLLVPYSMRIVGNYFDTLTLNFILVESNLYQGKIKYSNTLI